MAPATATFSPAPALPAPVRVEWLTGTDELQAIAGEWRTLEAAVRHRTHLPLFDFLATWYRHYAGDYGGSPLVGVARRNGRLVGVAPFIVRRGTVGRIPVTRVELAPSDVPAGEMLVDDDHPEMVSVLVDALVRTARFDVICFDGFDPGSPQLAAVRDAAARHRMAVETDGHAHALVDLRAGYEPYHASLSGHYRRNLNQKARKIEALGASVEGIHLTAAGDASDEAIARMIAINEASYKLQGQRLAGHHREFLRDVVTRLNRRGMLSLPILSIGGRDAAFILGVLERGCFYDITLAYDESFARLSPGAYLMQRTLEQLAAAGVHTVVSHGAHEYKQHWASRFVPQTRLFLFAPGLRAAATRFIRFELQPLWRRLRAHEQH